MTGNFFMVPNDIFDLKLKPAELSVLLYLKRCRNAVTGSCFPSRKTIAKNCCLSVRSVDKVLTSLISKNLITKSARYVKEEQVMKQLSNNYALSIKGSPVSASIKKSSVPFWFGNENMPFHIEREKVVHR